MGNSPNDLAAFAGRFMGTPWLGFDAGRTAGVPDRPPSRRRGDAADLAFGLEATRYKWLGRDVEYGAGGLRPAGEARVALDVHGADQVPE